MGNPTIPVLCISMVPCGQCTACVVKCLWNLFVKGLIMLYFHKMFYGDTTEHLDRKATPNNLVASIFFYPNCNRLLYHIKSNKVFPLKVKQVLFLLIASNMIKIEIDTTIYNFTFSMVWKHLPTGALVMAIYDDAN